MIKNMTLELNGVPYYVFKSDGGFKQLLLCSACLSTDRNLYMIDAECRSLMTILGIKITVKQRICWECVAMIKKINKFISRAKLAHDVLYSCELETVSSLGCLSKLTKSKTKILSIASADSTEPLISPPPLQFIAKAPSKKCLNTKTHLKTVDTEKVIKILHNDAPAYPNMALITRIQGTETEKKPIPKKGMPKDKKYIVNGHSILKVNEKTAQQSQADQQTFYIVNSQQEKSIQLCQPNQEVLCLVNSQNSQSGQSSQTDQGILYVLNCQNDESKQISGADPKFLNIFNSQNSVSIKLSQQGQPILSFVKTQNDVSVKTSEPLKQSINWVNNQNSRSKKPSRPDKEILNLVQSLNNESVQPSEPQKQSLNMVDNQDSRSEMPSQPDKQILNLVKIQNDESVQTSEPEKQSLNSVNSQKEPSHPENNLNVDNSTSDKSHSSEPEKQNLDGRNIQKIVSCEAVEPISESMEKHKETILINDLEQIHAVNSDEITDEPKQESGDVNTQNIQSVKVPNAKVLLDTESERLKDIVPPTVASESSVCGHVIATAEQTQLVDKSVLKEIVDKIVANIETEIPTSINNSVSIPKETEESTNDTAIAPGTLDVVKEIKNDPATLQQLTETCLEMAPDKHILCADEELCENENTKEDHHSITTTMPERNLLNTDHDSSSQDDHSMISLENSVMSQEITSKDENLEHQKQYTFKKSLNIIDSENKHTTEIDASILHCKENIAECEEWLGQNNEGSEKQKADTDVKNDVPCTETIMSKSDEIKNIFQLEHETKQTEVPEIHSDRKTIEDIYDSDFDFFDNLDIPDLTQEESEHEKFQSRPNKNQDAIGTCTTLAKFFEKNFILNLPKCTTTATTEESKLDNQEDSSKITNNHNATKDVAKVYATIKNKKEKELKPIDKLQKNNLNIIYMKKKQELLVNRITADTASKIVYDETQINSLEERLLPIYLDIDTIKESTQRATLINILKDHCYSYQRPFEFENYNYMLMGYQNVCCNKTINTNRKPDIKQNRTRFSQRQNKYTKIRSLQKVLDIKSDVTGKTYFLYDVPTQSETEDDNVPNMKYHLRNRRERQTTVLDQRKISSEKIKDRSPKMVNYESVNVDNVDGASNNYNVNHIKDAQNINYDIYTNIKIENCNSQSIEEFVATTDICKIEPEGGHSTRESELDRSSSDTLSASESNAEEYSLTDSASETGHIDAFETNCKEKDIDHNQPVKSHENDTQKHVDSDDSDTNKKATNSKKNQEIVVKSEPQFDQNNSTESIFDTTVFDHVSYDSSDDNYEYESSGADCAKPSYNYYDLPGQSYYNYYGQEAYENNSSGIISNIDATSQSPTGFESNNITVSFSTSFLDNNLSLSPIESGDDNAESLSPKPGTSGEKNTSNPSPDLLEPLYFTNWEDQTYEHAYKNITNEAPALSSKRMKKVRNRNLRPHKRKSKESERENLKSNLKYVSSKRLKKDSENTNTDNENVIDGINYEKLLLRPIVLLEKLKDRPVPDAKNTEIIQEVNEENDLKDLSECDSLKVTQNIKASGYQEDAKTTSHNTPKDFEIVPIDEKTAETEAENKTNEKIYTSKLRSRVSPKSKAKSKISKKSLDKRKFYTLKTLSYSEIEVLRNKLRKEERFKNARYKCLKCVKVLSWKGMQNHRLHDEISGEHICTICECRYKSDHDLLRHIRLHKRCFKCHFCSVEYQSFSDIWKHLRIKHQDCASIDYPCPICNKYLACKYNLEKHMKNFHKESVEKCTIPPRKRKRKIGESLKDIR